MNGSEVVARCARHIGDSEYEFNRWAGWADGTPWCANFLSKVLIAECGVNCNASASAAGFAGQFRRIADEEAGAGDIVFFNWDGVQEVAFSPNSHVAIVESFDHSTDLFTTIDGNSTGNVVQRQYYNNNASYFTAFFRPDYDSAGGSSGASQPRYRVQTDKHGWLDYMEGLTDTSGTSDDFAGYENEPINGFEIDTPYDLEWLGSQVRGIVIHDDTIKYQVQTTTGEWLKIEYGDADNGAGDDEHAIIAVRCWR